MPHPVRRDFPGSWHHVMNRGIARRNAFEGRADTRRFLAALARSVRRGDIEVHAYCVLATHYHLLVRSPMGRLSVALGRAQQEYTRYFNRSRGRDGALLRGRFRSKCVGSIYYRRAVVRYIDQNPVLAGLAERPADYPFGSAFHYARRGGPPWLERSWVEREVVGLAALSSYEPGEYGRVFGAGLPRGAVGWVSKRLEGVRNPSDGDLDSLVDSTPPGVRCWMANRARLADSTRPGLAALDAEEVLAALARRERGAPEWTVHPTQKGVSGYELVRVALLREAAALTFQEIARRTSVSIQTVLRRREAHQRLLARDPDYAEKFQEIAEDIASRVRQNLRPRSSSRAMVESGESDPGS